jgi:hypothetical protein
MVGLMSLGEQVDREFTAARCRVRIRGLRAKLRKQSGPETLLSFEEQRRSRRAYGGVRRGREGDVYFVKDGHHRVSVARFHGAEWIDAEVTEYGLPHEHESTSGRERLAGTAKASVPQRPVAA